MRIERLRRPIVGQAQRLPAVLVDGSCLRLTEGHQGAGCEGAYGGRSEPLRTQPKEEEPSRCLVNDFQPSTSSVRHGPDKSSTQRFDFGATPAGQLFTFPAGPGASAIDDTI